MSDGMDIIVLSLSEGDPAFYAPLDGDQQACGGVCDLFARQWSPPWPAEPWWLPPQATMGT